MTENRIRQIAGGFEKGPPATEDSLIQIRSTFGVDLPTAYTEFMLLSNGAEGRLGKDSYLILWSAEHVLSINDEHPLREEHPETLLFGANAATGIYAFDTSSRDMPVIELDSYDPEFVKRVGTDFVDFLERLANE